MNGVYPTLQPKFSTHNVLGRSAFGAIKVSRNVGEHRSCITKLMASIGCIEQYKSTAYSKRTMKTRI